MQAVVIAKSGTPTSAFGDNSKTVGSDAWAGQGMSGQASVALYARYDSWNVLSLTGGANDTPWQDAMKNWYIQHFLASYPPWDVPTTSECPDTESVYQALAANSNALNTTITTNLEGMVTVGGKASPGLRVLMEGYPDVIDFSKLCYSDWGIVPLLNHGAGSVVSMLNTDAQNVTGTRVKYVNNVTGFGADPVSTGLISQNRLYGYPHPSTTGSPSGQTKISSDSIPVLVGTGW